MQDVSEDVFGFSKESITEYIQEWIDAGDINLKLGEELKQRISYTVALAEAVQDADIVVEAVVMRLDVKREVFKHLDELCDPSIILCSNSSSIKISLIEDATRHPERALNMHFYDYPWRRDVMELMKGSHTIDEAFEKAREYSHSMGVTPLMVRKESTGFIFNRIWRAIEKECLTVADTGVASFEDVDRAWMRVSTKLTPVLLV